MSEQLPNEVVQSQLSIITIWNTLKEYKFHIVAATVLGGVIAGVVANLMQPVWEASALVQVGQVGQIGQVVEPPSRAVARVLNPSFAYRLLGQMESSEEMESPDLALFKASFKARQLPNTDLIEFKLRAPSKELTMKWIGATVNQLRLAHDEIMKPSIDRMGQQFAEVENSARDGQNIVKELQNRLLLGKVGSAEAVLYVMLIQQKRAELQDLAQRKLTLEEQMHPARTFPTKLVGEIYVSRQPVSPKKGLIIFLGGILSLCGVFFWAFWQRSVARA